MMKQLARIIGFLSLAGTIVPPILFSANSMAQPTMEWIMFISCVTWFAAAPFWMKAE